MASENIRRNMSYRKPVPQYEPTPPPSPFPIPLQALPPLVLDETTDELLSLPHSWGCSPPTAQRADPRAEQPVELLVPSMFVHTPEHSFTADRSFTGEDMLSVPCSSRAANRSINSHNTDGPAESTTSAPDRKKRGTHKSYRPPTPPLPAQHKRRRMTAAFQQEDHALAPAVVENQAPVLQEISAAETSRAHRGPSIRSMHSFTTEKTFVSLAVPNVDSSKLNVSSGWSGGLTTFVSESDPRLSGYPHPAYSRKAFSEVEFDKSQYQEEAPGSCNMLTSCGVGMKKFLAAFCC